MTDEQDVNDQLRAAFRTLDERRELAETTYQAFIDSPNRQRSQHAVAYRCRVRGCLLADVVSTAAGVVIHQPAYKLSAARNAATSSADGRRANTFDGKNHWKPRTFFADMAGDLRVECDHVSVLLEMTAIKSAITTRRGTIPLP